MGQDECPSARQHSACFLKQTLDVEFERPVMTEQFSTLATRHRERSARAAAWFDSIAIEFGWRKPTHHRHAART
jgi:hypothetical protein